MRPAANLHTLLFIYGPLWYTEKKREKEVKDHYGKCDIRITPLYMLNSFFVARVYHLPETVCAMELY